MRVSFIFYACLLILGCRLVEGDQRILAESSQSSTRWQFDQFSTQVEQNMQTIVLPNKQILFLQSLVDENEYKSFILQKYTRDEKKVGKELKFGDSNSECIRPKVALIGNIGFALGWIQKQSGITRLYIQIINFDLDPITQKQEINDIHLEVHWDFVSEFHYLQYIKETKLLVLYKGPNQSKIWNGLIFDYQDNSRTTDISLIFSKEISIAINQLDVIVLIQKIDGTPNNQATILNYTGQIQRTFKLFHYNYNSELSFQPKITALSNNNFIVVQPSYNWITVYVYDQRFSDILNNNQDSYSYSYTTIPGQPSWENQFNFQNELIELQALEDSFVIVGINRYNYQFNLVHLKNINLELIQQRIINYEDLNIYRYSIQRTGRYSIFVQWIDGQPETLIPQYKQNLYLSELNLQLNIEDCGINCNTCQNDVCTQCNLNYSLVNNDCQPQCIQDCQKCSNSISCEICQDGYILTNKFLCVQNNNNQQNGEFRVSLSETTFKKNVKFTMLPDRKVVIIYQEDNQSQQFLQLKVLNTIGETILQQLLDSVDVIDFDLFYQENVLHLFLLKYVSGKIGITYDQLQISDLQQIKSTQLFFYENESIYLITQEQSFIKVLGTNLGFTVFIQGGFNNNYYQRILSYTYDYNGQLINQNFYGETNPGNINYFKRKKIFDAVVNDFGLIYVLLSRECDSVLFILDQFGKIISQNYQNFQTYWNCRYLQNPSISFVPSTSQILIALQDLNNKIYVFRWNEEVLYYSQINQNQGNPQLKALDSNSFVLLYVEYHLDGNFKTLNYLHQENGLIKTQKILNQNSIQPGFYEIESFNLNYLFISMIAFKNTANIATNQVYIQQISIKDDQLIGLVKICDETCSSCDDDLICVQCKDNYQLDSQNKCQLICQDNCSYCEVENYCEICQEGYQLNNNRQCIQAQQNSYFQILNNLNKSESQPQIAVGKNGNIIITWMEYDPARNRQISFYKVFDSHGVQIKNDIFSSDQIDLAKVKTFGEYFILSARQNTSIILAILDQNGNFVMGWRTVVWNSLFYDSFRNQLEYDIEINSNYNIFIVYETTDSVNVFKIYLKRLIFIQQSNDIKEEIFNEHHVYDQRVRNLKIQVDVNYIYLQYQRFQINQYGFNSAISMFAQIKYNLYVDGINEVAQDSQYIIVSSQTKMQIIKYENSFELAFFQYNSLIYSTKRSQIISFDQIDVASVQDDIFVIWVGYDQDKKQSNLFLEQFSKQGLQIQTVQIPTFSNLPSNPKIGLSENGNIIITWQDKATQDTIYAVQYNKHLKPIPLNSIKCMANCDTCMTTTQCSRCSENYYLNGNKCQVICQQGCFQCRSKDACDICNSGYYLNGQNCQQDQTLVDEHDIASIEDYKLTKVAISAFSDTSFVVVWNNKVNLVQTLHFQFYDSNKQKQGDVKQIFSQNDRQYAQTVTLTNDSFAVVWFEGDCNIQCRLALQIYNKDLQEQITEITIDTVKLPSLQKQKPVVLRRQDNRLIIAYVVYKDSQTKGYYTIYEIDTLVIKNPQIIEDNTIVNNLDIIVFNPQIFIILYVQEETKLKALRVEKDVGEQKSQLYYSGNSIYTPTHVINTNGNIVLAWSESILENNEYVKQIMLGFIDSNLNKIADNFKIQHYIMEQLENPILIGNTESTAFTVFSKSSQYFNQTQKKIMVDKFDDYHHWSLSFYSQMKSYAYEHYQFQIEQLQHQDYILVDVGLNSWGHSTIFMMRTDNLGNQMKLQQVVCPQYCQDCNNNHSCLKCQDGYQVYNQQQCIKICPVNSDYCDTGDKIICSQGYQLNKYHECIPLDPELTQQLITTNQFGYQKLQNIATLSNKNSIVVWTSRDQNQNFNGVSIYMQLFDTSFSKVGAETLITKDAIGAQENPNVAALQNNEFIVIWKDSNPSNVLRVLMQKFSINFERIGNEIVLYDSVTNDLLFNNNIIYQQVEYRILQLSNKNLAVLLGFGSFKDYYYDLRLKLFDENLMEFKSILIGQTYNYNFQVGMTQIDSILYVLWKNQNRQMELRTFSVEGDIINGRVFDTQYDYYSITKNELNQLVIAWSNYDNVAIQRFDQNLQEVGDQVIITPDSYVNQVSLCQVDGGIVLGFQYTKRNIRFETSSIQIQYFDNYLVSSTSQIKQLNDYNGQIENIKISYIGNYQYVVTWSQNLFEKGDYYIKSDRDASDFGLYAKRLDTSGNILKISNVICQTNCNKCSKQNLCESCNEGFYFDSTKSICQIKCPSNCIECPFEWMTAIGVCRQCQNGYTLNQKGECDKIIISENQVLYKIGQEDKNIQIQDFITLQNGNIVIIYYQDGKQMYFKIIDNQGEVIIEEQYIPGGDGDQSIMRITSLSNGNFAIVNRSFNMNSNNNIWLHIYDQNGREIQSQHIVTIALWNYYYWWNLPSYINNILSIKSLSGGGFAVTYMNDNNGQQFSSPKILFRVYNNKGQQISNDIPLNINKVYNDYYWDLSLNNNQVSVLETETHLVVTSNYQQYYWWDSQQSIIQVILVDKYDYSTSTKFIDMNLAYQQVSDIVYYWWSQQRSQIYQTNNDEYIIFSYFPTGIIKFDFDKEFQLIKHQVISQNQLYSQWSSECAGCCFSCWNSNLIQILQLDRSFVLQYYADISRYYYNYKTLKLFPFNFNMEKLSAVKEVKFLSNNRWWYQDAMQQGIIKKYLNNKILLMSIIRLDIQGMQYNNLFVLLERLDYKCNQIKTWEEICGQNCLRCISSKTSIQQCLLCDSNYYIDDQYQCQLICEFDHCQSCDKSGTKQQFCNQCESGFRIKDNQECVQSDPNIIVEKQLGSSLEREYILPRVKALSDGTILVVTLQILKNQMVLHGQLHTSGGENNSDLIVLAQSVNIGYFDYSTSSLDEILIVWVDFVSGSTQVKAQKYDKTLQKVGTEFIVYEEMKEWKNLKFATVEYLNNDEVAILLFGNNDIYIKKFDQNMNELQFSYVGFFQQDYWWWLSYWEQTPQFFEYLLKKEPSIVSTTDFIFIAFQQFGRIVLQVYDSSLSYQSTYELESYLGQQPSITKIENGNVVLVWVQKLEPNSKLSNFKEIPSYQRHSIVYTIIDPYLKSIKYNYFGLDYVKEFKPDVAAIPNGFAISFGGLNEINSRYIDVRVVYFDLQGNQQSGFIPISFQTKYPQNSNITPLQDGSIIVTWNEQNSIYAQKLNRNGVIQPFNSILCPQSCKRCTIQQSCDACFDGFMLNSSNQCQPICLIPNCSSCSYWSDRCNICNDRYYLDEMGLGCKEIDNTQNYEFVLQENIQSTTLIIENVYGEIIHLWLNYNSSQLFVQTFTSDGSIIIDSKSIMNLQFPTYDAFQAAYHKETNQLVVLLANPDQKIILQFNDKFEQNTVIIKLDEFLKSEYLYLQLSKMKLYTYYGGIILLLAGDRKSIIDQFAQNPRLVVCNTQELILLDLQGNQQVPSIIFKNKDKKVQNLFLDESNSCLKFRISDIIIDDYIYVLLFDDNSIETWIQTYNFQGQIQNERNLKDFIPSYLSYGSMNKFQKEIFIMLEFNHLIRLSTQLDLLQFGDILMIDKFQSNFKIIRIDYSQICYIYSQQFDYSKRYKLVVYDYQMKVDLFQGLIAPTSLIQGSFSYIIQQNNNLLFSWLEQGENNANKGKVMISRFGQNSERLKFQEFQCLPICTSCTAISKCQGCIDNYQLAQQQCVPICSSNCKSCTQPLSCDICLPDYYIDDSFNCVSLAGQPIETQLDSTFDYAEDLPRVASFLNGGCVIVWQSKLQDGSGFGVYAQLISPEGVPVDQIIRVNVNTKNSQFLPDVTILPNNNVIIVWADGDISLESELYFQIFDQELNRIGTPTFIDYLALDYYQYYDRPLVVQGLSNNEFVIAWVNNKDYKDFIFVSLFNNDGVLRRQNQITDIQFNNEIVINSNGLNFVVVYRRSNQLAATVYDFEGLELASVTHPIFWIASPSITSNARQEYVLCWRESEKIKYSLFDTNLNLLGSILEVEYLNTDAINPDIAATSNGFVIVWQNYYRGTSRQRKLRAQIFDINGVPSGPSFEVNVITIQPEYPQISVLNNDKFLIIWDGLKPIGDENKGIFMMKFGSNGLKELIDSPVCSNKCRSCSSSTSCIKCSDQYQLIEGFCVPQCPSNCSKCSKPNFCDLCKDGFKLDPSGLCSTITSNLLPEDPILSTPFDELPSFSSSITIGDSDVLIYSGTVTFQGDSYFLNINLQLIANTNQHDFSHSIKLISLKSQVLQSNVLVREDNSIQVYWVEMIEKEYLMIKLITISYDLVVVDTEIQIDTIPYDSVYQNAYNDFVLYLYYQNTQYQVVYSRISDFMKYEVFEYKITKNYLRITSPNRLLEMKRQLRYGQICFNLDSIVIIEINQNYLMRLYNYNLDFKDVKITENQFTLQYTIFIESFTIRKLKNTNFVLTWKTGSTQSLTSKSQIYYTLLNSDLQRITDYQVVADSNGKLENPQIIILQGRFAIIWNNFISITYSQLSISFYEESGIFISQTKQLNTISNNIKLYYAKVINTNQIAIQWLSSYTTVSLQIKYQYYYLRITDQNQLLPSPTLICLAECATCSNEYTCQTCITNYALNPNTYKCEPQCPDTCLVCSSPTICSSCKEGYSIRSNNQCEKNICKESCSLCNTFQHCLQCPKNFYQSQQDMTECIGTCGPNCLVCTAPPVCKQCDDSYYWSKTKTECVVLEDVIGEISISEPLIATFPNGDYIALWSEEGPNAGVYFQLYKKSGQKIGTKTQVNMDELGNRRLLQSASTGKAAKTLFSDIATFDKDFVILWVDQIVGDMKVNLKKFDVAGQALTKSIQVTEIPKQNLDGIAAPCIIKKTANNNFVIGFFNQAEQSLNTATMFLQSFSNSLAPIGQMQILDNADISKVPMISSDEDGLISITFSSEGATFLAQITTQGDIVTEPKEVGEAKAFKSTNLKNKYIVFVFEAVSTNISPPQYILSYQIMNLDKILSEAKLFASPSYGEEHPYVTSFGYGFIIVWRTVDKSLKSKDIVFQIFDSDGLQISNQTQVTRKGLYPKNPGVQVLNDDEFYITWTAAGNNTLDNFYLQLFNISSLIIQNPTVENNQTSIICPLNCLSCLSNSVCQNCQAGYYVENNFCQIDCGLNCVSCTIPNQCTECTLGYEVSLNQTCSEIECEIGYTLSDNMDCVLICPEYCSECQSNDICLICESNYALLQGQCIETKQVELSNEVEVQTGLPFYYIIIICLGALFIMGIVAYGVWKYKKRKPIQNNQQRQVIDERDHTALDSRIN
ncbi:unnamed protein product (macronuclear) [Paramecium tetraurelia]|uniref:EGF-like domain-containing protein n=1 Tax=Paramecium tetraurelia TaxID=5888 RepID=A0DFF5_PARTE|nr:uncharacterized protein GSPATT00016585001 [Paramecium tetraurelia]CAK81772.1 unnamed protein product [Paramecium tetraurelia]|eukprot:XP_001449169.1 hypothetical protein (macronuclear) [Paramecium tetraurelia strain d4-2]